MKTNRIKIFCAPFLGPPSKGKTGFLPPLEQRYKITGYCDDLKPAITNIYEFHTVNRAVDMFEAASGCILHRDVVIKKCKVLLLGSWKHWSQDNIPLPFLTKSNYLDMLGVKLFNNYSTTKKENGEIIVSTIKNICNR